MMKKFLPLGLIPMLLAGCSTTITNLTPSQLNRNTTGLYPFEVAWDSNEQCVVKDSIKPYVYVEWQSFPMQPTPRLRNRWEALVPVPANAEYVNYHFKFDYQYRTIPEVRSNSINSQPYQLHIINK
jgi:hypothetical protein